MMNYWLFLRISKRLTLNNCIRLYKNHKNHYRPSPRVQLKINKLQPRKMLKIKMHVRIIFYGHSYIINKKYVSFLKIPLIYYYVYDMIVRNQIIFFIRIYKI